MAGRRCVHEASEGDRASLPASVQQLLRDSACLGYRIPGDVGEQGDAHLQWLGVQPDQGGVINIAKRTKGLAEDHPNPLPAAARVVVYPSIAEPRIIIDGAQDDTV
jgi:hypothetical protein